MAFAKGGVYSPLKSVNFPCDQSSPLVDGELSKLDSPFALCLEAEEASSDLLLEMPRFALDVRFELLYTRSAHDRVPHGAIFDPPQYRIYDAPL